MGTQEGVKLLGKIKVISLLSNRALSLLSRIEKRKSKGLCNDMYPSETAKIRDKVIKYIKDTDMVLDVGCGSDLVVPHAIGIDARDLPTVKHRIDDLSLIGLAYPQYINSCDVIFSSHCLEHVPDDHGMLWSLGKLIKPGGILAIYLPDTRYYDDAWNVEHVHSYIYEVFLRWFERSFADRFQIIEHGPD